jgi:hypothetical protein
LAVITDAGRTRALDATKAVNTSVFADPGLAAGDIDELVSVLARLRHETGDF